jgi:RNA methyltransferase, TrmH family
MLTRAQISLLQSLNLKKNRDEHKLFVVEGVKMAEEFLFQKHSFHIQSIIVTNDFAQKNIVTIPNEFSSRLFAVTNDVFEKISNLKTPQGILIVVNIPEKKKVVESIAGWSIYLDDIQDPGNLGSIIRIADWFGIQNVFASSNTVDCFNTKVLQSCMGSILRVQVQYKPLSELLAGNSIVVYGAFMNGTPVHNLEKATPGIIVIGNEGKGISSSNMPFINQKIAIAGKGKAESLNAAIACGIIVHSLVSEEL